MSQTASLHSVSHTTQITLALPLNLSLSGYFVLLYSQTLKNERPAFPNIEIYIHLILFYSDYLYLLHLANLLLLFSHSHGNDKFTFTFEQ